MIEGIRLPYIKNWQITDRVVTFYACHQNVLQNGGTHQIGSFSLLKMQNPTILELFGWTIRTAQE